MGKLNVFGGKGFVGSEFCKNKQNLIITEREDYNVYSGDVLYFISTVHNYNVYTNPHLDIDTNLTTLVSVLENWRKVQPSGVFNFISSWFVYGRECFFDVISEGIKEDDICDPKGFYSITKRAAEQLLISYCETYNLQYRILRLANVLGKEDKKVSAQKNALQHLINEMKENKPINLYENGLFFRDYIDVSDCVKAIELVLEKGNLNEIYNIGNGIALTFKDLLLYAHEKMESKSTINNIPQMVFHKKVQAKSFFMNNEKLKSLGYTPSKTIYQTIDNLLI
jgi:nucleoside-diphosphate-sugar epimerase